MNIWLKVCDNARQTMHTMASMLHDKQCSELLDIVDVLSKLAEEACEKDYGAVGCGMYAAYYRLAGSVKSIATIAEQTLFTANNLSADSRDDTIIPATWHQDAVWSFAAALEDCCNDLMHLTSEIGVMLEHPFVVADDSFHCCLQAMHDALEEHVELFYEMGDQLNSHPVLGIAAQK